jgi:hypothetical protein
VARLARCGRAKARATQGIIDDGLLEALCADLDAGSSDWHEGRDVRGQVHVTGDTRVVSIRWIYL